MNASTLVSDDIIPLRTSTLGSEALEMMNEFLVGHLPVVNDKQLLGLVSEADILDNDVAEPVGSFVLSLPRVVARGRDHIFDIFGQMTAHHLSAIPVVDLEDNYLGLITHRDIVSYFGRGFGFDEPGGILVLNMAKPDYSLSEIARILESEKATILASFITEDHLSNFIKVHVKVNQTDLQRVVAVLERFEYEVEAMYSVDDSEDIYKDRYESFMHYLRM